MNTIIRLFGVFSYSATKAGKEKCGDAFSVLELPEESLIVVAVADGVSSRPCDWLASKTACETIVSFFPETTGNISERMKFAAAKAHSAIKRTVGSCQRMLTSLSLTIWEIGTDEIHYLNVGDSRIYAGREDKLKQITRDDAVSVPVKSDGTVLLESGSTVLKHGVTRSLGQNESLDFEVLTHEFSNQELLVLMSDGIYKNEMFTLQLQAAFAAGNFTEQLKQMVRDNSEKNNDDATIVVLWRAEEDEKSRTNFADCFKERTDFREKELSAQTVLKFLQSGLRERLSRGANDQVNELLDYALQYGLKFSRMFLSEFLSSVIKQGTDRNLVAKVRNLIRVAD